MAGKTNTKQICVFKTKKALLEIMDDTRYEKEPMAWPHTTMSRIRMHAKDYSKGTGDLATDTFYNLSPDEFYRFHSSILRAKTTAAQDIARCTRQLNRLEEAKKCVDAGAKISGIDELRDLILQFAESSNDMFSEAGHKLLQLADNLSISADKEHSANSLDRLIAEAAAELETAKKAKEIFADIKILNYDKYVNPENSEERRVTMIKVTYLPQWNYPYSVTIANGWGIPLITKLKGVIIKEGSTHFDETVVVSMDDKGLLPMLKRVEVFLQAMTAHGLTAYFDAVSNPVLFYQMEENES